MDLGELAEAEHTMPILVAWEGLGRYITAIVQDMAGQKHSELLSLHPAR